MAVPQLYDLLSRDAIESFLPYLLDLVPHSREQQAQPVLSQDWCTTRGELAYSIKGYGDMNLIWQNAVKSVDIMQE